VAESIAFTVTGGLVLSTAGYSIPYLAAWSQDTPAEAWQLIAELVDRHAQRIENAVDGLHGRSDLEPGAETS
jgi:hypothetical protein